MTTTQERLADALGMARLHVAASAGAEHMMDGFGPRSSQPSDLLLAEIDAVLAAHDAEQSEADRRFGQPHYGHDSENTP